MSGFESEREVRNAIVEVGRRLWEKGFVAASDGNVSVRVSTNRVLSTPSGVSKGFMRPRDIIVTDLSGRKLQGDGKATSELRLHLEAYRVREDISAVVHAHPPIATAFTIAGVSLAGCILPEVVMTLGSIPTTSYAPPSSSEGPAVIRELVRRCDALLLERHGALAVGKDVFEAYMRIEKIEHTAHVCLIARQLGGARALSPEQIRRLREIREEYGYKGKTLQCTQCGICDGGGEEGLVSEIAERVIREIRGG